MVRKGILSTHLVQFLQYDVMFFITDIFRNYRRFGDGRKVYLDEWGSGGGYILSGNRNVPLEDELTAVVHKNLSMAIKNIDFFCQKTMDCWAVRAKN